MKSYPSLSLSRILPLPTTTVFPAHRHRSFHALSLSRYSSAILSLLLFLALIGGMLWFPNQLFAIEFEKDDLFASLNGSLECKAPISFIQETTKEKPSFSLLIKTNTAYGSSLSFYGEIRSGFDGSAKIAQGHGLLLPYDKVYPSKDWYLEVPEAYFSIYLTEADLRIGIQKFSWGTLDMINPTDNLNPLDMRHVMTARALEKKVGIPALRVLCGSTYSYEAIWIPFPVPYRFPDLADRWYPPMFRALESITIPPYPPISVNITNEGEDLPAYTFQNGECGVRISRTIGSVDIGFSYFNGYDRKPVFESNGTVIADLHFTPPDLTASYLLNLYPVFHRIQIFGMETAASLGSFTFRAEGALCKGRYINIGLDAVDDVTDEFQNAGNIFDLLPEMTWTPQPNGYIIEFPYSIPMTYQKDTLSIGGGIDYQWGGHLLTLQLIGDYIQGVYDEPLMYDPFELTIILGLRSQFFDETLNIEGGLVINPMQNLCMVNTLATYSVSDTIKIGANLIVLDGQSLTAMGQYRHHDQIEFFARYSF